MVLKACEEKIVKKLGYNKLCVPFAKQISKSHCKRANGLVGHYYKWSFDSPYLPFY